MVFELLGRCMSGFILYTLHNLFNTSRENQTRPSLHVETMKKSHNMPRTAIHPGLTAAVSLSSFYYV